MSGELLFCSFNIDRYSKIKPALDNIMQGNHLNSEAIGLIQLVTTNTACSPLLNRILKKNTTPPRTTLKPEKIEEAINEIIYLSCFEKDYLPDYINPIKETSILLDAAVGTLFQDSDWFEKIINCGSLDPVPYSRYGETALIIIPRYDIPHWIKNIFALRHGSLTQSNHPNELNGFLKLLKRVNEKPGFTLVMESML